MTKDGNLKEFTATCQECGCVRIIKKSQWNYIRQGKKSNLCQKCAIRKKAKDPTYIEHCKTAMEKLHKDPEWLNKVKVAAQKRSQDPIWLAKNTETIKRITQTENWKQKHAEGTKAFGKKRSLSFRSDPEIPIGIQKYAVECPDCGSVRAVSYTTKCALLSNRGTRRCRSCSTKYNHIILNQDPEKIKKRAMKKSESMKKVCADPAYKERQIEINRRIAKDPERTRKISEATQKLVQDPEYRNKISNTHKDLFKNSPEHREKHAAACRAISQDPIRNQKISETSKQFWQDPLMVEKRLITIYGEGFWYGHLVLNKTAIIYCEIWKEVKPRILAFNKDLHGGKYVCEICDKEIEKSPVCHHVFYEKKACCWVTEDGDYTTNLNVRSIQKDAYLIGPNPNYFAVVHRNCHGLTNGKFENREKWANWLKDKIDTNYGGKSYYTKQEADQLKVLQSLKQTNQQSILLTG